ncbi:MAG: 50S ribosomal protein L18 [Acidobacteria bacterium]|nr:50S ribosomal protein L18 [Acidobacteriota bacterium]
MQVNRRKKKEARRAAVRQRVRRKVLGTPERPRLAVFRSNRHLQLQVIDDSVGRTVAAVSTLEQAFKERGHAQGATVAAATEAGKLLAERAGEAGVKTVVFDRGGYNYHGRVRAVAEAVREAGLVV